MQCETGLTPSQCLFALYIEPLAQEMGQNQHTEWVVIKNVEHKISLYAVDILVVLSKPNVCGACLPFDLLESDGQYPRYTLIRNYFKTTDG